MFLSPLPSLARRDFLKGISLSALAYVMSPVMSFASAAKETGPFKLPGLPYAYNALVPVIDEETMKLHHGKHHQAYIDKLNAEVAKDTKLQGKTIDQIVMNAHTFNDTVRNNAGGHWNHSFFWKQMTASDKSGQPSTELLTAIEKEFGSFEAFKDKFEKAGVAQFGSGWVWLIRGPEGNLKILTTANQDNPLMEASRANDIILANDLWEHAYYLTYRNKRAEYLKIWWKVVNWDQVSENYATAIKL